MNLDGSLGDLELSSDLFARQPTKNTAENIALTGKQVPSANVLGGYRKMLDVHALQRLVGDLRRVVRLPELALWELLHRYIDVAAHTGGGASSWRSSWAAL